MKKIFTVLLLCLLTQTSLIANAAAPAKNKKASIAASLGVKASDCRKIEGFPTIVVCVEGDPGDGVFDESTLRTLKVVTSNLITKYQAKEKQKKEELAATQEFTEDEKEEIVEETRTEAENPNCHQITGSPNITVCVTGDPGNVTFDENALRVLKGTTKNLITKYKAKKELAAARKMSVASACGPMPDLMNDPMGYAAWMGCTAGAAVTTTPPADPCAGAMGMMTPGCPGYVPPSTPPTPDPEAMCQQMYGMSCADYAAMMNQPATPPTPDPEAMCQQMYGMSCADYSAMMNQPATPPTTTDPEAMCQQMYGMSCADYSAMMNQPATPPTTTTPPTDPDAMCQMMYGMTCADYARLMTGGV